MFEPGCIVCIQTKDAHQLKLYEVKPWTTEIIQNKDVTAIPWLMGQLQELSSDQENTPALVAMCR